MTTSVTEKLINFSFLLLTISTMLGFFASMIKLFPLLMTAMLMTAIGGVIFTTGVVMLHNERKDWKETFLS